MPAAEIQRTRCPNPICAAAIREGSRFCHACGHRFDMVMPPVAPLPVLGYLPPDPSVGPGSVMRSTLRISLVLGWLACLVAWVLVATLRSPESVLFTGPVIAVLLICGAVARLPVVIASGATHCGICILFAVLVNLLNWSPRQAKMPFTMMGGAYVVASLLLTAFAMRTLRRSAVR